MPGAPPIFLVGWFLKPMNIHEYYRILWLLVKPLIFQLSYLGGEVGNFTLSGRLNRTPPRCHEENSRPRGVPAGNSASPSNSRFCGTSSDLLYWYGSQLLVLEIGRFMFGK